MLVQNPDELDELVGAMLRAARVPGAAIAIVVRGGVIFARGYGYRDLEARLPTTEQTVYPIASTTKSINSTLLGMLVDERKLGWDTPVQEYVPGFCLGDDFLASSQVTVRDLVTMRTGLPRHDWAWMENSLSRAELVGRLKYLDLSAGLRERFQYNNLTVTAAGYLAEVVTGERWEELARKKIFEPLGMSKTGSRPLTTNVSLSYHESARRELVTTKRLASEVTAPSGGAVHSTVEDMARWISFNLNDGKVGEKRMIQSKTLADIHSPQVVVGSDSSAPTPDATYAMGWFVDTYNGCPRLSHGGYIYDVNSEVTVFPKEGIGVVSFTNFGPPRLARLVNEHVFDRLMGFKPVHTVEEKLEEYERQIEETRERNTSVVRIDNTAPSHSLSNYAGMYLHPGYGAIEIDAKDGVLRLRRNTLVLPLEHRHYDTWAVGPNDLFQIHQAHAFDRTNAIVFETSAAGEITAFSLRLEPAVAPIRFIKQ